LENELNSNLKLRREQINSKLESLTLQVEETKYNNYSNDLNKVSSDLKQLEQKISGKLFLINLYFLDNIYIYITFYINIKYLIINNFIYKITFLKINRIWKKHW